METIRVEDLTFQLDLTKPLYEQVLQQIRHAVARGELKLGSKLPSVRELAQALKINPNTVMRSYQELERDNLIETRRGQGTFLTSSPESVESIKRAMAAEAVANFIKAVRELGLDRESAKKLLESGDWS